MGTGMLHPVTSSSSVHGQLLVGPNSQDVVSRIVDDDDATLAEAKISAERGKLRATYDRAKGSTGCGGRAVIVEGDADKDALQEVCRYGSQRRVCRRHASVIKIVYFCRNSRSLRVTYCKPLKC